MSTQDTELATFEDFDGWQDKSHGSTYTKMKEIRFCGSLSKQAKAEGIPEGNFFLFDPNVGQGESPLLTDLGQSIKVNIIRDMKRLELYDEYNGKDCFTVTSSEFRDNDDLIFLYDCTVTDGKNEIVALLPYINAIDPTKCIKHLKETRWGGKLRTKYVTYCLWYPTEGNPEVVSIGFTATDNTGCLNTEFKPRGFQDYAADSFLGLKSAANKIVANKLFVQNVEIFSKPAYKIMVKGEQKDSSDRIKAFRIIDQISPEQKGLVQEALKFVRDHLSAKYAAKSLRAYANTLDRDAIITLDPRYIPLMIGNPGMITGYELIPGIDNAVIPAIDVPESDRNKSDSNSNVVEAVVVPKKEPVEYKTKAEVLSAKRSEMAAVADSPEVKQVVNAVEKMHADLIDEQAAKLKEVNDVFGM